MGLSEIAKTFKVVVNEVAVVALGFMIRSVVLAGCVMNPQYADMGRKTA